MCVHAHTHAHTHTHTSVFNLGNRLREAGKYRRRVGGRGERKGWLFSCSLPWFIITWWARCVCVCVCVCVFSATHWGGPVAFVQIKCWCRVETAGQSGAQVIKALLARAKTSTHTHTHTCTHMHAHTHTYCTTQWAFYFGKQTKQAKKWK